MSKLAAALILFFLASCGGAAVRGNYLPESKIAELKEGRTKDEVARIAGSPSAAVSLDGDEWIYVGSLTRTRPFRMPEEDSRRVVRVKFPDGMVSAVEVLGLRDGRSVAVSNDATPTEGNSVSLADQLIGNIGRFEQRK